MADVMDTFPRKLISILETLRDRGATPYLVGGSVRDYFMGNDPKDFDFEVFGRITMMEIKEVLRQFGSVNDVGASFGVLLFHDDNFEAEFAVPRRENKVGKGHKDFDVQVDPTMTVEEAASRRDFTINSIMIEPFTGEVIDSFDGMNDLVLGVLNPVSDKFREDPLRVLRGMQFAGRFDLSVTDSFVFQANEVFPEYRTLPNERIWEEWKKWALRSIKPSRGIEVLENTNWLTAYKDLYPLKYILQDPLWHPEGTVLEHTKHALDHARILRDDLETEEDKLTLMFAVLLHDVGKISTTTFSSIEAHDSLISFRIIAPRHAEVGSELAEEFLWEIGAPGWLVGRVGPLVREHMIRTHDITARSVRRLSRRIEPASIRMLAKVMECDSSGRPPLPAGPDDNVETLLRLAEEVRVEDSKPEPILMGRHLIEYFNMEPSPMFGDILDDAYEYQLDGEFETLEEALEWAKERNRPFLPLELYEGEE
jgi:tRNA nucleotidyltransferase (CCA-adding enzyme)